MGSLALSTQVRDEVPSGAGFSVEVTLAPGQTPVVDSVSLLVRDSLAARTFEQSAPPRRRT